MKNSSILAVVLFTSLAAIAQMQSLGPKDTFATAKLSAAEVEDILKQVERSAYDQPDDWTSELRVRRVDLGSRPGLVLHGSKLLCGATGNCQLWVFRREGGKWLTLFSGDQAPIAEGFQLGPNLANGIEDLTITANSSAEAQARATYKFDGRFYRVQ
jgi:hypothetical protein